MAYRLKRSDKSIEKTLHRIVSEQIEAAIVELVSPRTDRVEMVHSARKHCKQLRALIRLIRPGFADFDEADDRLRALAAPLALTRDADVMIETCDTILREWPETDRSSAAAVRRRLLHNRKMLGAIVDLDERLATFVRDIAVLREDAAHWRIDGDGFDMIAQGAARNYRKARKAMKRAATSGDAEDFHDWRKSVKYHWYHTRLLAPIWPTEMAVHVDAAHDLGEVLGHHHDLAVLDHAIAAHPEDFGGITVVAPFRAALAQRSGSTADRALNEGGLLLSESPSALVKRWRGYWEVWRAEGDAADQARAA
ncbi:CHAD domain-containing protein [Sphingomonas cavernae]|uniref:CHAD domain-containing protein n=1 Tax=Sphingomonas cavernae TaxID=2320861 RepID=A0A418W7P0_9SPHN|nr:CHAD domain-containing protein [Sphingomonas cavernae]RJF86026.1 CHAD domain-containing protein [Sphingomonas cavernae]